jgi:hypothetical protein
MVDQTRLYLRTNQTIYRPVAWFRNNKPNELLIGLYGLRKKQPVLRYMWPERELEKEQLDAVRFDYRDKIDVGYAVDHVTCHADGRFHVKTANHKDLYVQEMQRCEPLGPDTTTFLELIICTDIARNYCLTSTTAKVPNAWIDVLEGSYVVLRGMFSGANYDIESVMAATLARLGGSFPAVRLASGTVKGVLAMRQESLSEEAAKSRPQGTILSFKFPVENDRWHIKSFLFE